MHDNISKVTSGITISVADITSSDSSKYLTAFRRCRRKKDNRKNDKGGTVKSKYNTFFALLFWDFDNFFVIIHYRSENAFFDKIFL